ncbi:SDR family NAD(P)-dependent oxidoreductase [Streptomyces boluensis]|uniref:Glucose 1-dehydrogenase n=1 Tax=Streptomyces boluensis TaxID=1775135 RepID=A0A964XQH0_9ACTN|nr:glucose 1-dehydrogenase [Streptomyces boluensis]NBE55822.1 glucose 1-dehydrogenase [Streptomyces boluensis]
MSVDLAGKVALVTGAARGMGEAEARLFVACGAKVVLTDVREDEGRAVAAALGPDALFVRHDVTAPESWESAVATAVDAFGKLDVLVNNAALYSTSPIEDEDPARFEALLRVDLVGPFLGIRAAAKALRASGGGSIVNISSTAGLQGMWGHGAYGAAKWGLRGLTKTAALELGPDGIRVNSVHPGAIDTAMTAHIGTKDHPGAPLGRVGEPEEVARLVAFLACDDSSYLSGAELAVDGGASAGRMPVFAQRGVEA